MYNGAKVLDVHSHLHDTHFADSNLAPRQAAPFLSTLMGASGIGASGLVPSPIGPGKHSDAPGNTDEDFKAIAASLAKYMDVRNIDTQIMSVHPLAVHGWLEPASLFKSWIRYSNDMVFKVVQAEPSRFVGACQLPQLAYEKDTTHCLEELERCVTEYGFVATYVSLDITGRRDTPSMNMPYWYPLYEKCQELGIPIIVHGTNGLDPRYATYDFRGGHSSYYQLNFMSEQSMATVYLRHNDQFERFPGLKIIICHCGGFVDRLIGSSDFLAADKDLTANLFYDTCAYDLDFLALAIKQRGISQFAYGTEAPGSGRNIRPGTEYTADDLVPMFAEHPTLSFLSEQDKQDIFYNTPAKLAPGLADAAATNAKAKVKAY
jgi:predicted TIM-barrel fold metal-dependent hydrolase